MDTIPFSQFQARQYNTVYHILRSNQQVRGAKIISQLVASFLSITPAKNTLKGHTKKLTYCTVTTDDQFIISTANDYYVRVWHLLSGQCIHIFLVGVDTRNVCLVSADNKYLITLASETSLQVRDFMSGSYGHILRGHSADINDACLMTTKPMLISGANDFTLKIWNLTSGTLVKTLTGHHEWITDCVLTPNNQYIISSSDDHTLKIWSTDATRDYFCCHTLQNQVNSMHTICCTNTIIASAGNDCNLSIWDVQTGQTLFTLEGHDDWIFSITVAKNENFLVSAGLDHTLKIWCLHTGSCLHTLWGHTGVVVDCQISTDNQTIISASMDGTCKVWHSQTGLNIFSLPHSSHPIQACTMTTDTDVIITASHDHTLKLWCPHTGTLLPPDSYDLEDGNDTEDDPRIYRSVYSVFKSTLLSALGLNESDLSSTHTSEAADADRGDPNNP